MYEVANGRTKGNDNMIHLSCSFSDYGDTIEDLGECHLQISHEEYSRRQIYVIFSLFGKIKAILSYGYVKIYFYRREDAGSQLFFISTYHGDYKC